MSLLTKEHIDFFLENGYVCIENVLNDEEIQNSRNSLHEELLKYNVNHENIINGIDDPNNTVRIKSEISNIFYAHFKLNLHVNEIMYETWKELINNVINEYPLGHHDDIMPYIDRICWRLPDCIRQEGGLDLHLDRRPGADGLTNIKKYRPIQGILTLTDHYGNKSGGLKVVKGFHNIFDDFFSKGIHKHETQGEFFRMGDKSYTKLQKSCHAIDAPAGSLILWDNRLPHSTCQQLEGFDSREVIYMSYIPNVPLNIQYTQEQTENFIKNIPPPAYNNSNNKIVDRNYDINILTDFQKKILKL